MPLSSLTLSPPWGQDRGPSGWCRTLQVSAFWQSPSLKPYQPHPFLSAPAPWGLGWVEEDWIAVPSEILNNQVGSCQCLFTEAYVPRDLGSNRSGSSFSSLDSAEMPRMSNSDFQPVSVFSAHTPTSTLEALSLLSLDFVTPCLCTAPGLRKQEKF